MNVFKDFVFVAIFEWLQFIVTYHVRIFFFDPFLLFLPLFWNVFVVWFFSFIIEMYYYIRNFLENLYFIFVNLFKTIIRFMVYLEIIYENQWIYLFFIKIIVLRMLFKFLVESFIHIFIITNSLDSIDHKIL
jgi:hypothetical protein